MRVASALVAAVCVAACSQPVAAPSPSASAPRVAEPTATPTAVTTPAPHVTLPAVLDLSAPSRDLVWGLIGRGFLFVSSDRGATWAERRVPEGGINDISFISALEGWALAIGPDTGKVALWHTVDGATTWRPVRWLDVRPGEYLGAISFVDAQRGYLSGSLGGTSTIYRTADGGANWYASAALDPPGPFGLGRVKMFADELLVARGDQVFRSSDRGVTWALVATAPGQVPAPVAFANETHWGTTPMGIVTDDAGATWRPWTGDYRQAAGVAPGVVFADAQVVYATVRGELQRSDDGGTHWVQPRTPGT